MTVREGREQELVRAFFEGAQSGFFVEVGANRPRQESQTWHLEQLGWSVERFVVGDQVPRAWTGPGSQHAISKSFVRRLAADLMRLALGRLNARRARRLLRGRVDLVYERFGAFQALGAGCRKDGIPWILETNGPLFYEARIERKSLVLSGLARRLERAAYQQCDLLVCISHQLREIIIDLCGVPRAGQ